MPGHAVMVQGELGWPACEVVSTGGVCVAGMTALKYASMAIASGQHRAAVATGSELASASMKAEGFLPEIEAKVDSLERHPELAFEKDFLRWMLSDGAGAVLLEREPRASGVSLRSTGSTSCRTPESSRRACTRARSRARTAASQGWQLFSDEARRRQSVMAVKQDVKLLHEEVVRYTVEEPLVELTHRRGLRGAEIDHFLPHYSSLFFRDKLYAGMQRAGLDVPQSRWFSTIESTGNTGSASIYITLDALVRSGGASPGSGCSASSRRAAASPAPSCI